MAAPKRRQKLKVYRTPIGFHDAFVAAPSQKAALEAWGADTNLFGRGIAEQVTDAKLTKVPLENPGQVVKVLRGTAAEQLAALEAQETPKRRKAQEPEIVPTRSKKRLPKPSRAALAKAQEALDRIEKRQEGEIRNLEKQQETLERKLRDLKQRHESERDKAQQRLDDERSEYEEAIRSYEAG
ncbi:hypothetical protein LZ519_05275 [Sphingomonas sp. RG327]|jgi:hypothetical protein|uniref:Cell envelope biogenesis protein TolA n=1 Tax=Sphingomonas anseongensis TaxID=2908207 RepID=A0ABT0REL7_9SPHN|nr:hypothetical protein [Sphingomonas anseongensis]MCL6678730.1 hypothetical protein [Sphingomonas anseongensis]